MLKHIQFTVNTVQDHFPKIYDINIWISPKQKMASWNNAPYWGALNQADEWKALYIRATDFLEAMDIDMENEDPTKKG